MNSDARCAISITEAARQLGKSTATVRRWIAQGAPTVALGKDGRGNGSLVDVDALRAWRTGVAAQRGDDAVLRDVAIGIRRVYSDNVEGHGKPAHKIVSLADYEGAAFLVQVFFSVAQQVLGRFPDELPQEISDLEQIVKTAHR